MGENSLENFLRKFCQEKKRAFFSSWWEHHDDVTMSAFTTIVYYAWAQWVQAHTHERVAERAARRRKDESTELRSAVSSSLISSLVSYTSLRSIHRVESGRCYRANKTYLILICVLFACLHWDNFPGQPRCMWVYALPDSTRGLCLATKVFSPKKPQIGYLYVLVPHITPLVSTGNSFLKRNPHFWGKIIFGKILIFRKKHFYKKRDF